MLTTLTLLTLRCYTLSANDRSNSVLIPFLYVDEMLTYAEYAKYEDWKNKHYSIQRSVIFRIIVKVW